MLIVALALAAAGLALFGNGGSGTGTAAQPDPCTDAKAEQEVMAGTVTGATAGAAAGPHGAAIGAGAGTVLAALSNPCSASKLAAAKKRLCAKADSIKRQIEHKGGAVPNSWDHLSCDEKLAWVAALTPFGVASILAGALVGKLATDTVNEVKRNVANAEHAIDKAATSAENTVKGWGKRVGF